MLFEPGLVYPSDDVGFYDDLTGEVVSVKRHDSDDDYDYGSVDVKTEHGIFTGWTLVKYLPKIGYSATIRVYDAGGGFYPDNRITGWRANDL